MLNPVEEIKNRINIVDLISSYIALQKAGVNYRAPCPFHSEKKPSFFVSPARQIWHCFGACSDGGDIFKFIMKIEGVEFGDALRILAKKAGVELKKQDPKLKTERQRLYEIGELSCQFFEKQLEESNAGQAAKKYLLDRKISEESVKKWRLGYAPESWQGLSDFLIGKGYKKEEIVKAGLAVKKDSSDIQIFDRFRSRIIFPVFDLSSQVVGFGGRIFGDTKEVAKYLNTPNTLIYDKSRILYGLDKARMEVRKKGFCVLVEGYVDAVMVSQAGFENVAAVSGTALTVYQLTILKRYSENILTAFDMDAAGGAATKKGIDLARKQGFNIKVIMMPKEKDPADIISENPENWEKLVKSAREILEFYFETALSKFDRKTPEGKNEISKMLLPEIKRIPSKIIQSHWVQKLSDELGVKTESVEEELKKVRTEFSAGFIPEVAEKSFAGGNSEKKRKVMLEISILVLIFKNPSLLDLVDESFFALFSEKTKDILKIVKENPQKNITEILAGKMPAENSEINDLLNNLSFRAEVDMEMKKEDFKGEILKCLGEIKSMEIKRELNAVSREIKEAEKENDSKKTDDLIKKFNKLSIKLTQ